MSGNAHKPYPCHYFWIVSYSKGSLTRHLNKYHWEELEKEAKILDEINKQRQEEKPADEN